MSSCKSPFTMGVEEEYQIVDAETRELSSSATALLAQAKNKLGKRAQPELHLSQIEAATAICWTLHDVRRGLARQRREMSKAAERYGTQIAASGTHPFSHWKGQSITPKERYLGIVADYQQIAREPIYGCHVHIGVEGRELALQIMNRVRPWLAPLLALAANSPFWLGEYTGYASFRTLMWSRWPTAGPPQIFSSLDEYHNLIRSLVAVGSIGDATNIYWDVRLSERYSTLEFRVTDICLTIDEAVMIAGLVRALVRTCYEQALRDEPVQEIRTELLRASHWRAARYGLSKTLIDACEQRELPAREMIERLLAFLRPALEEEKDWDEIAALTRETLYQGNGASRQLAVYQRREDIQDVVDYIMAETAKGI
ncbi:MAG: carboxylate-amine ligase [Ktedonobacteraceae bacterium]|nr:carboxylate-amine ligase [Ktedonobacteraceae bacterium]MBO0793962.1 carboxylate-amine ligase [Ktedonobacteraceae bacterium]